MRKGLCGLALAAILVAAAFAATAQARGKILSFQRAEAATMRVAERDCRKDPSCESASVARCRREAIRKIRCLGRTEGTNAAGPDVCERPVLVRLVSRSGDVTLAPGDRVCEP